jgi:hypothetical protein
MSSAEPSFCLKVKISQCMELNEPNAPETFEPFDLLLQFERFRLLSAKLDHLQLVELEQAGSEMRV